MSDTSSGPAGPTGPDEPAPPEPSSPEVARLEADLERTREQLAQTVDALGARLDVRTRAGEKVTAVREERGTQVAVGAGALVALVVVVVVWRRRRG